MSEYSQNLRTSLQTVRRHKILAGVFMLLGLLAGASYSALTPPMLTSNALVVLPGNIRDIGTQTIIAGSDPVLSRASERINPTISVPVLQSRLKVVSLTANVISITAQGTSGRQAEDIADAVADSYIAYAGSASDPAGPIQARVLEAATGAVEASSRSRVLGTALLGALVGLLTGAVLALAVSRNDRRLRYRDDIADAIGVPIIASVEVSSPTDPNGWTKVLESYRPTAVEAWRLRSALHHLGLADVISGPQVSVAVLSISSDRRALAVGPQLASFAADLGIPTTLVFGPQQVPDAAATLRAACVAVAKQPRRNSALRVAVNDLGDASRLPDFGLAVVVGVVDGQSPSAAATARTTATVLAVSSGAATAEQLARVAASAFADGRSLAGIVLADPDPADRTTGRHAQLVHPAQQRVPARALGNPMETRS